ncbi:MAG: CHAD domain-containing protein [Acidobacteriia bacterium]|nr:CHAD domain-containing protein [Terriglobia bacterium]
MNRSNHARESPAPDVEAAPSPAVTPEPMASESKPFDPWRKVRKLALRQLDRFVSLEPKVLRGDDPDAIHDLRVASRRLQQVLDLLYPAPRAAEVRKLRRKIRRSRGALGEVRNCDVQLQRVEGILARKRTARRKIWEAVRHYLRERRAENFEKAVRKLSKINLAVFYVHLKDLLVPGGTGRATPQADRTPTPAAEEFGTRVTQSLEGVWQRFEAQVSRSDQDSSASVIHAVRIAAKRLRYLIEVIHAFNVSGSGSTLAWLRSLQQHLGNWHDREVLEQMMIAMVARPEFLRDQMDVAMGVERLILQNRKQKQADQAKYFQMTADSAEFEKVREWVRGLLESPAKAFEPADQG